jgi:hypothetical protein
MTKPKEEEQQPSRVDQEHGGELVEAIAPEDLVSVNDANCKHEMLSRIQDDLAANAFECTNPNCHEIFLYDKVGAS